MSTTTLAAGPAPLLNKTGLLGYQQKFSSQITIRLTEDEYAQLESLAAADERLVTDTARRIFRRGLPLEGEALRARGITLPDDGAPPQG